MLSPANYSLEGTIAALREERMKKAEIRMTERKTNRTGFVSQGIDSYNGGRLKSFVLGGTKPSPAACKLTNARTHTPRDS
jgi:hypothetical protein